MKNKPIFALPLKAKLFIRSRNHHKKPHLSVHSQIPTYHVLACHFLGKTMQKRWVLTEEFYDFSTMPELKFDKFEYKGRENSPLMATRNCVSLVLLTCQTLYSHSGSQNLTKNCKFECSAGIQPFSAIFRTENPKIKKSPIKFISYMIQHYRKHSTKYCHALFDRDHSSRTYYLNFSQLYPVFGLWSQQKLSNQQKRVGFQSYSHGKRY